MAIHADFQGRHDPNSAVKTSSSGHTGRPPPEGASPLFPSAPSSPLPSPGTQGHHAFTPPERPPDLTRTAPKRRRALHDVDGPFTGSLGCKKRRLRRDLITSRLSRPYSSPATHILNREAAAGAKRFLKMAAAAAAKKLTTVVVPTPPTGDWNSGRAVAAAQVATVVPANSIHHLAPAEMVRRAAIMNRFRIRVCDEARERGDRTDLEMTAGAALLRAGPGSHGVGFVTTSKAMTAPRPPDPPAQEQSSRHIGAASHWATAAPPSRAAHLTATTSAAESSSAVHPARPAVRWSPPSNLSKHARPCDAGRVSPRLRPLRSPELTAQRSHADFGGLDEDELSFPATDYSDDFLENESDEVYTDFGAIFGGGRCGDGADGSETIGEGKGPANEDGHAGSEHFEDYMDDLDGIPWGAR
ncbi:hypothetical protein N8I77_008560 [Diaporthe amygdali]|uniref:Uncharacterized protein n=1 Tax=Phomopsis amygdali TaxID=1214568 RepID=A0AAD9SFF1_PHOAM|nr:hypothetical protein N8I77_008560 [Diaporthe amygdali]